MPKKTEKSIRPRTLVTAAAWAAAAALVVYTAYHFSQASEVTVVGANGLAKEVKKPDSRQVAASGKATSAGSASSRTSQPTQKTGQIASDVTHPSAEPTLPAANKTQAESASALGTEPGNYEKRQHGGRGISTLTSGAPIATRAKNAEEVRKKAREYFQAGQYSAAVAAYREATALEPGNASSFAGLGASFLAANDTDGAIVAYQRAIQLAPNVSEYYAGLGRAYFTKGDKERAINAYKKAQEIDPHNSDIQMALQRLEQ